MTKRMFIRGQSFLSLLGSKGYFSHDEFDNAFPGVISRSGFCYWLAGKNGRPWCANVSKIDKVVRCLGCQREDIATEIEQVLNPSEINLNGRWRLVVSLRSRLEHEGVFELIGSRLRFRPSPGYKLSVVGFVTSVSDSAISGFIRIDEKNETNVVTLNFSGDVYESNLTGKGIGRTQANELVVVDFEGTKLPEAGPSSLRKCKPR
jgi:hypothetical protein